MAIIDPDGYFGGDRFDDVSDMARTMWPTFYLASNTAARLEINYRKVCATAFSRWKKKPTEQQFWAWVGEYQDAFLLFVYEAGGSVWGQWDTSEKFLPRHKLAADLRTPAPPSAEWIAWKNDYAESKAAKSNAPNNFKVLRKLSQNCADLHTNVRGVGVGVGVGVGKVLAPTVVVAPTKGTRFCLGESLPAEWAEFCSELGWDFNRAGRVYVKFGDYWCAQAGARGVKLDWLATWRNWCRNDEEKNPSKAQPHQLQSWKPEPMPPELPFDPTFWEQQA